MVWRARRDVIKDGNDLRENFRGQRPRKTLVGLIGFLVFLLLLLVGRLGRSRDIGRILDHRRVGGVDDRSRHLLHTENNLLSAEEALLLVVDDIAAAIGVALGLLPLLVARRDTILHRAAARLARAAGRARVTGRLARAAGRASRHGTRITGGAGRATVTDRLAAGLTARRRAAWFARRRAAVLLATHGRRKTHQQNGTVHRVISLLKGSGVVQIVPLTSSNPFQPDANHSTSDSLEINTRSSEMGLGDGVLSQLVIMERVALSASIRFFRKIVKINKVDCRGCVSSVFRQRAVPRRDSINRQRVVGRDGS